MSRSEIRLEFEERTDKEGQKYLFCKPGLPATISLKESVFFLWVNDNPPTMSIALERPPRRLLDERKFNDDDGENDH